MSPPTPPDHCDVVVVGGGVGGLTTAALLAKRGLAVTVLERNPAVGGCLAPVRRGGFTFDSSIHWLNQAGPGGLVAKALALVGPDAPAARPQRCFRRYKSQAGDFALTPSPDELLAALLAAFPANRQGLEAFFATARRIGGCFADGWGRHPFSAQVDRSWAALAATHLKALRQWWPLLQRVRFSTEDGFRKLFGGGAGLDQVFLTERRLVSCLVPVGWAYQGDFQSPPPGGAAAYPRWLAEAVSARGGDVLTSCQVDGVIVERGRAAGVRFVQGGERRELRARAVVAACDIGTVYARMLPPGSLRPGFLRRAANAQLYDSAFQLYLGLDRPAAEFGIGEEHVLLADAKIPRAPPKQRRPRPRQPLPGLALRPRRHHGPARQRLAHRPHERNLRPLAASPRRGLPPHEGGAGRTAHRPPGPGLRPGLAGRGDPPRGGHPLDHRATHRQPARHDHGGQALRPQHHEPGGQILHPGGGALRQRPLGRVRRRRAGGHEGRGELRRARAQELGAGALGGAARRAGGRLKSPGHLPLRGVSAARPESTPAALATAAAFAPLSTATELSTHSQSGMRSPALGVGLPTTLS